MSKRGNFASNEVPFSKILVFKRESNPSYSFIIIIYLLKVGEFFFPVDMLNFGLRDGGEDRTIGIVVACYDSLTTLSFFLGPLFLFTDDASILLIV